MENQEVKTPNNASNPDISSIRSEEPIDFTPKSEADFKKENRTRRIEKIIGAVGDGLMSLSNLYFTSKGAPSHMGDTNANQKGRKNNTFLTKAIIERHKEEDNLYEKRYKEWKDQLDAKRKADQALQEKNRRFQLYKDFGIKESNWGQSDFINQLYDGILEWNKDTNLTNILASFQYEYQPIWEWMGSNWAYEEGHDKKIDLFKGKSGTYLKRDLIETLFGDESWTTPENRQNLIEHIREFENTWIPLK